MNPLIFLLGVPGLWALGAIITCVITDAEEYCEEENKKREEEEIRTFIRTNNERRGMRIKQDI